MIIYSHVIPAHIVLGAQIGGLIMMLAKYIIPVDGLGWSIRAGPNFTSQEIQLSDMKTHLNENSRTFFIVLITHILNIIHIHHLI